MKRLLAPLLLLSATLLMAGCYTNTVSYTPGCSYVTTVRCTTCKTCNTCNNTCNRCSNGCCNTGCSYGGCGYSGCGYSYGYGAIDNGWY